MEDVTVYSMDDDPWNRKRQQTPPGLDEIFNDIFGGKKSGSGGSKGISFTPLIMALLVLFIASGFFIVGPAEKAVIVRLGKVHRVAGPGPNWVFPIAESRTIVDTQKISSINYNAEMLTSDESYADVDVTVFFRVAEPVDYLYNAVSDTARYGGLKSGNYLIDDEYENKLRNVLNEIKNGKFAKDLETNVDTLKYKSSIDSKSSDEISKIMDVLFEKKKGK